MKKIVVLVCLLVLPLALVDPESCWGGRGLRGGGGGGFRSGGGGVVHTYGGNATGFRTSSPVVGPSGGTGQYGRGGGSVTTPGGSTINYRGGGVSGTTPGGIQGGKYVGGIQVSTPGGKDFAKVGTGGVAVGPGGKMVGGKTGVTVGSGPQGSFASKYQGGVAIGPQGGVAGKSKVGVGSGPGGTVGGGGRTGVAYNPYGAVAGRTTVAGRGTYYRSATAIQGQAVQVRRGVATYPCFRPNWYTVHPNAWFAAGWVARSVWRPAPWETYATFYGYAGQPVYYDYGENVVYQDDGVYVNGYRDASAEEYAQQATTLADTGRQAKATKEEEWLPLGVFAMVQGEEQTSNHIFQLAVNQQGVLRGNYYDAVTDTTSQVYGSVDRKTQRAAWTVGKTKTPVYECGMANLTKNEMTMLVHYGQERTQQFSLIRVEDPEKAQ